jgi:hypothetical protein
MYDISEMLNIDEFHILSHWQYFYITAPTYGWAKK